MKGQALVQRYQNILKSKDAFVDRLHESIYFDCSYNMLMGAIRYIQLVLLV